MGQTGGHAAVASVGSEHVARPGFRRRVNGNKNTHSNGDDDAASNNCIDSYHVRPTIRGADGAGCAAAAVVLAVASVGSARVG